MESSWLSSKRERNNFPIVATCDIGCACLGRTTRSATNRRPLPHAAGPYRRTLPPDLTAGPYRRNDAVRRDWSAAVPNTRRNSTFANSCNRVLRNTPIAIR